MHRVGLCAPPIFGSRAPGAQLLLQMCPSQVLMAISPNREVKYTTEWQQQFNLF